MRIDLRDGMWAELHEHLTHAEDKRIKAQYRKSLDTEGDDSEGDALNTLVVRIYTKAWHVLDRDGNAIPLSDEDAIDRAPDDVIDTLVPECSKLWKAHLAPKEPTPSSSDDS
jgi:hypothetical protein